MPTVRVRGGKPSAPSSDERPFDDWLAETGTIDWFPNEAEEARSASLARRSRRPARAADSREAALLPLASSSYLRRRLVGLVAVVAVVAVAAYALFGGGGGTTNRAHTPPATTSAPPVGAAGTHVGSGASTAPHPASKRVVAGAAAVVPTIRLGQTGRAVKTLQLDLHRLGFSLGKPDGIFGPDTRRAVVAFQRAHGLQQDGVVGPRTAAKLNAALGRAAG
jgi:hypothetical protein